MLFRLPNSNELYRLSNCEMNCKSLHSQPVTSFFFLTHTWNFRIGSAPPPLGNKHALLLHSQEWRPCQLGEVPAHTGSSEIKGLA